jgi:restriction system protein
MTNNWMVRAGRGGIYSEDFEKGYVAIGWSELGDLTKFSSDNNLRGKYLVGRDKGEYSHQPELIGNYANLRTVDWLGKVSRDALSQSARNSLGSVLTFFSISQSVIDEFIAILEGKPKESKSNELNIEDVESVQLKDETVSRSHELIKDKIIALAPEEMEELVASILRAMGYKAKVSPKGPDRGVDVIASPDGLGLTQPRIKAEVKHRSGSMGAPIIRGFIGALREGESGLFISTGGFTKEAHYEAERSTFPLTLIDLDDLADLIVSHYPNFDLEGRALIPLVRIFWPVD